MFELDIKKNLVTSIRTKKPLVFFTLVELGAKSHSGFLILAELGAKLDSGFFTLVELGTNPHTRFA